MQRFIMPLVFTMLMAAACASADDAPSSPAPTDATAASDATSDTSTDSASDASDPFAEPPLPSFDLQPGSGESAFEPITAATVLPLIRGSQGLQHVFISLRAPIPRGFHRILVAISEPAASDTWLVQPFQQNVPWSAVTTAPDLTEVVGVLVVVEDANRAVTATSLQLHLRVDTADGRSGITIAPILIAWP